MSIVVPLALVWGPMLALYGAWFAFRAGTALGEQKFHNRYMGHPKWYDTKFEIWVVVSGVVMGGVGIGLAVWGISNL